MIVDFLVVPLAAIDVSETSTITNGSAVGSTVEIAVKAVIFESAISVNVKDELVRQMEFAYAKATDSYVMSEVANNGTLNASATTEDASGLISYVASAAAAVYSASLGFARNLVVSPQQWGKIMGYAESNGRPIYTASNPSNAGGTVSPQSLRGNIAGLELYVSRSMTGTGGTGLGDYSMVVLNPDSYTWYESPRLSLRTAVINTGQIDVNYYGFGALATKIAAGAVLVITIKLPLASNLVNCCKIELALNPDSNNQVKSNFKLCPINSVVLSSIDCISLCAFSSTL